METHFTPDAAQLLEYVKGTLDAKQQTAVETWAASSPGNEKQLLDIARLYYLQRAAKAGRRWEAETAYRRVVGHIARRRRSIRIDRRIVVAASLVLCIINAALWAVYDRASNGSKQTIVLSSNDEKKVEYTLPDGTSVYLNRNSSLTFPMRYAAHERRVSLEGEGYFEVAHDAARPFIVNVHDDIELRVLGTKFNLQAFAADSIVQAVLLEGRVSIRVGGDAEYGSQHILNPSDMFRYNTRTAAITLGRATGTGTEWMDNTFVFEDTPLPEVIRQLAHNFDVDFTISDPILNEYLFTGTFDNRELALILDYMRFSSNIAYEYTHGTTGRERIVLHRARP